MKNALTALALAGLLAAALPAQRAWQQITVPSVRDAAANFKTPPREYGAIQPFRAASFLLCFKRSVVCFLGSHSRHVLQLYHSSRAAATRSIAPGAASRHLAI
jgi:hypothetical protein